MSAYLQTDLWVVVQQSERPNAPRPLPLESGFSLGTRYKVMGLHCPSETSEAYFILCNDRNEVWFVSNQHFRVADGEQYRSGVDTKTNGHAKVAVL
jgi:hypothetical protein